MLNQGTDFALRDKRLFELTEVEKTRFDCICRQMSIDFGSKN